ncbi:hypothetical protein BDA96_05G207300 [Sorghum bicolor]|uniref:BTB domain-containing protein n=2 Tax=Sorghum bicolor TaxID=4558 RepID=A0A921QZU8_SORBI|nr:BTB/POZ and MATH domain-containing protein 2 [Sorghum bicolor]KAG0530673.1 hypothetical protein BDA96_05G207300 [Sorghum bicolor]KXG28965.1 hypothetical protein SORBI_3005G190900 [Sorghum bicolor]|eukprot:XP_021317543.1 BTB/POZ and MATH domain-containing protein 2 [Sorghum bicolor]
MSSWSRRRRTMLRNDDDDDDDGRASTTMLTEIATGWHVLKVERYSKINGLGVARRMKSCPFVVGGHTWCIAYFPDRRSHRGHRRLHLFRPPSRRSSCRHRKRCRQGQSCCDARFMERKEFESCYVKDDEFCIRCDVTVLSAAAAPPLDLRRQLGDLLAGGDGADVTLDVGGESFRAHKNVLAARSPVFMAEFFGGPHKEQVAGRVSIHGIEPSVFKALLHFIYTDSLPDIDGGDMTAMAQHLLVAADRYGIQRLKSICEYLLRTFVDRSAVVTTLVLAERHGCHQLKEACFKVMKSSANYKELVSGEDFQYLASTCPSLVQELEAA